MSILIKSMEMPKSCRVCPFCVPEADEDNGDICVICGQFPLDTSERSCECPLIEVPPHGRLIDANPIMKFIQDGLNNGEFGYDQIKVMGEIQYAPTIIESEE